MHVKIGDAGLRNWYQTLLFGFSAEVVRYQRLDHVVLEAIAKTLADDGSRHVSRAKAWQPRTLLIALNLQLGFASNFGGRDLNRDFPLNIFLVRFRLYRVSSFCGAHVLPFTHRCIRKVCRAKEPEPNSYGVHLSVKTEGEDRQTR